MKGFIAFSTLHPAKVPQCIQYTVGQYFQRRWRGISQHLAKTGKDDSIYFFDWRKMVKEKGERKIRRRDRWKLKDSETYSGIVFADN